MRIQIERVTMAYDELTAEAAAERTAKEFGIEVKVTSQQGPGGWPEVTLIGTPAQIITAFTDGRGWSMCDEDDDAEQLFHVFQSATVVA